MYGTTGYDIFREALKLLAPAQSGETDTEETLRPADWLKAQPSSYEAPKEPTEHLETPGPNRRVFNPVTQR